MRAAPHAIEARRDRRPPAWHDGVKTGIGRPTLIGALALLIGFGGFGAWAAMAPIEGAVIAQGRVVAAGNNKVVQHLEGGIVKEILVEEGEAIRAGDPVLVLDGTASEVALNRLGAQLVALQATEARALAERDGAETIALPAALGAAGVAPEMTPDAAPDVARAIADQKAEFEARRDKHMAELAILAQQVTALEDGIVGLKTQLSEVRRQIELIAEERVALEKLLKRGLTRKSQVLALKRTESDLRGREGQLVAEIAKSGQGIAQAREKMEHAKRARVEEASARLAEVRLKRAEVEEELRSAEDRSARIVVRAPAAGKVINLVKHNQGAIVAPGQTILEIVPEGAGLLVEARLRPQDIDKVRVAQPARLVFAALDTRKTPPVPGEVAHVSADRLLDERTGETYYLARLAISPDPLPGFDPKKLGPGQPVDVFITTGERTLLEYLAEPITKSLRRAIREG